MIGTNNRNKDTLYFQNYSQYEYCGKATYIVPFPTWKVEAGYTASLMQILGKQNDSPNVHILQRYPTDKQYTHGHIIVSPSIIRVI